MKNPALLAALHVSMENVEKPYGEVEVVIDDSALDAIVESQADNSPMSDAQTAEHISSVESDIEVLGQVRQVVESENVSLEQLAHCRGVVDSIGHSYGAPCPAVSLESFDTSRLEKDSILNDIVQYQTGLESHVVASMEGMLLGGNSIQNIGKNLDVMKKMIILLKSGDVEKLKEVKFAHLKPFLKIGGGFPEDVPKAIREVAKGLELTMKHSDVVLTNAIKAAEIAIKTDWTNEEASAKGRAAIKGISLNLDGIVKDINGYPMFGNRAFGIKVKGSAGDLGDWNKHYSFGDGSPNAGLLHTALLLGGSLALVIGTIASPLIMVGGVLMMVSAIRDGSKDSKREMPMKEFAAALESYSKTAEQIYKQRTSSINKSTVHGKLLEDLKTVNKLPGDVRKSIAQASSFGWAMTNGVYNVVEHSVYALAEAGVRASFH